MKKIIIITWLLMASCAFSAAPIQDAWPPKLTLPEALALAQDYVRTKNISTKDQFLSAIRLNAGPNGKIYWDITWANANKSAKGGFFDVRVYMDKKIDLRPGE